MDYNNLDIITSRKVYEPSDDTYLGAIAIENTLAKFRQDNLKVLDIGTGTGALGLVSATNSKVRQVVFCDINPSAIKLAKKNFEKNKKMIGASCKFVRTDMFSKVKGKYDLVIFNAPYLPQDENTNTKILSRAWEGGKEGIEICLSFVDGLKAHLSKQGKALLIASSFGNLKKLKERIKRVGLRVKIVAKKHVFFEDIVVLEISRQTRK